ncbi:MAG: hypothetical protein JSS00_05775 [Proteobacteria bacterium]|nr:hypothetical protein [Pseudomonadota bacterium]
MNSANFRGLTIAVSALGAALTWCGAASAQTAQSANTGHWILDTRLRYEGVSQDGLKDAEALTFRARLGYETPLFRGWRGLAEFEGVGHLTDTFNDTVNGRTAYASVPDPEALDLNRLQLAWSGENGLGMTLGRQRIILNNARFVGNAGFRQNEQTFDALRVQARPLPHLAVTYIYLDNVYRTAGNRSPQGRWASDSHVVQADLDGVLGKLSAYALLLDFRNAATQSSQTYGARWQNDWKLGEYDARLTLEAAAQSDYANAPRRFDLGYQAAELAVRHGAWNVTLGGERLEGDGARGFSTPLATLHAFQGWADVFVNTPPDGVRDLYAGLTYNTRPWPAAQPVALTLTAHTFSDDGGARDFGDEIDASARFTLSPHAALEFAAAAFNGADPRFADRDKIWVSLEYKL